MLRTTGPLALRIAVVAASYFVAGRLSLLLAIPPGYATAAWPPAGIALAAAILWGPRVLPGVWIGSFAANATGEGGPIVAASIALGATAQAALGAWLAGRVAGPGNPLDGGRSVLPTLLVGGPLACLVSATWGTATLALAGALRSGDVAFGWATWWAGDTIGVLVFLPTSLAWSAAPADLWRKRRWTLTAPLVLCFGAVVGLFLYARAAESRRVAADFQDRQRPIGAAIVREIERASDSVVAVSSLFYASNRVDRDEFATFAARTLGQRPGVRALHWCELVRASDRAAFERSIREEGFEDPVIRQIEDDRSVAPAATRPRYFPVRYTEPQAENLHMLGVDLASEPVRRSGIEAAIRRGEPTLTGRLRPVMDTSPGWSVLLFVPVYAARADPRTETARDASAQGVAAGLLRLADLVEQSSERLEELGLAVCMRDLDAPESERMLYGDAAVAEAVPAGVHRWEGAGRRWELRIASTLPPPRGWSSWFVLSGGLLLTGLFGAYVLEIATRQIHVERLVAVRTRELARANDGLQRSNLELQRFAHVASHDLREPLRAVGSYAQLLDESAAELEPAHRKVLERIVGAARRMHALVDDLLALSRVEGGATTSSRVPLDKLLASATENLQPAIEAAGARVESQPLPTIDCDPSQIVQLFQNLVGNAVKFRREGEAPVVRVATRRDGAFWEITVRDNGIGIAPEHHARVFEMFERLHPRERYGGTGIGLAICRRIVDRHGGRIWLESPREGGSVFHFTLRAEGDTG